MKEIWKDIPNYEGLYQVSNLGMVRRIKGGSGCRIASDAPPYILKGCLTEDGYHKVLLTKNSKARKFSVHRLVAIAFVINSKNWPQVNHIDGVKLNNTSKNLEWCSASYNQKHAYSLGLIISKKGVENPACKLTNKDIIAINSLLKRGLSQRKIAAMYNVAHSTIGRISRKELWKHIC